MSSLHEGRQHACENEQVRSEEGEIKDDNDSYDSEGSLYIQSVSQREPENDSKWEPFEPGRSRRRKNKRTRFEENSESDSEASYNSHVFRKPNGIGRRPDPMKYVPKIVVVTSTDVNLAKMNPLKIAKALQNIGTNIVKKVNKVRNGIAVHCYNAAQAAKLMKLDKLGDWPVKVDFPKSEIQSKGVITGISMEVTEAEILHECKISGVSFVRRLKRKVESRWEDSWSMCLTFDSKELPETIAIGYEVYNVKPYVEQVVRCFKCQGLGHMAATCKGKIRCVRCGGLHAFVDCQEKDKVKCCRCGGKHSAAYEGCEQIKLAKKIQNVKAAKGVSYAEAAKTVNKANITDSQSQGTENGERIQFVPKIAIQPIKQAIPIPLPVTNNTKIIKYANATTQTAGIEAACQTESTCTHHTMTTHTTSKNENNIPIGQQLLYLITGVLNIYENKSNKKERNKQIEALIQKHEKHMKGDNKQTKTKVPNTNDGGKDNPSSSTSDNFSVPKPGDNKQTKTKVPNTNDGGKDNPSRSTSDKFSVPKTVFAFGRC